jgi:hypothetical protein
VEEGLYQQQPFLHHELHLITLQLGFNYLDKNRKSGGLSIVAPILGNI